ncbi:MAG TPA: flagellin [Propionibacteriaceae bacterium]
MGMTINTNMSALTAYRNLSTTQNDMSKSLEKLSSGLRINRAADDAAGLAISEGLKSQVGGLMVAARNAQDGISVAQTAEGSLGQVQAILQRMRDLAVQAGNDSNNVDSRKAITAEATQLTSELGRVATSTNFNGINLLDGSAGSLSFQVGANAGSDNQIQVDLSTANVSTIASTLGSASGGAIAAIATPTLVTGAITFTAGAAGAGTSVTTTLGAAGTYKTVQSVADALNKDAGFNATFNATVNTNNELVVRANSGAAVVGGNTAGTHASAGTGFAVSAANGAAAGLDFSSATGAKAAITLIDTQITKVSSARAGLGAIQNRLDYAVNNLNISKENLTASRSRITDTDMASEMVNFTRSSILSQAGTAMLAQANQSNQGVLQLLR